MPDRIVCLFSCGAASAVATKLAIAKSGNIPLVIFNNEVIEEHPDNKRFLLDCQKWFGISIDVIKNEKYHGSIYSAFVQERYIKNRGGAVCTRVLKREVRMANMHPRDRVVFGYTAEEQDRLDRFIDANADIDVWAPLIEDGLTKADCLAMIERAGIDLPAMYKLGYKNNNCRGCVKGGMGYWNKIRIDFPEHFEAMATIEQWLGPGAYLFKGKKNGDPRRSLRDIAIGDGNYQDEPEIQCGVACEAAERTIRDYDDETCES